MVDSPELSRRHHQDRKAASCPPVRELPVFMKVRPEPGKQAQSREPELFPSTGPAAAQKTAAVTGEKRFGPPKSVSRLTAAPGSNWFT